MRKAKWFRLLSTVAILCTLIIAITGCGSPEEDTEMAGSQEVRVQRGDLTVDITAAGNLALSQTENIVADFFYQQATIAEVNVETGDSVTEGQVLVKIDIDEWQEELDVLEDTLAAAERNLNTQERALATTERLVTTRELAVTAAKRQVSTREIAYQTTEINLEAAEYALATIQEVKDVQDDIDNAEYQLQYIQAKIDIIEPDADPLNYQFWSGEKAKVQTKLAELQQEINEILAGTGITISDTTALEIQRKQLAIETARLNLESASDDVIQANLSVIEAESNLEDAMLDFEYTKTDIEDAKQNIESVNKSLEEAREKSPEITAPFDGFIVNVNVEGGDEIIKGTILIQIADPDRFEADILVSETDILQVEVGTSATVIADAISGISFPAKVTHISPTATISSGVVNYTVRVELQSIEELAEERQSRMEAFSSDNFSGEFSPPEGFEMPEGFSMPGGRFSQGAMRDIAEIDYNLREGMSVTVSLIISSETDVLLIPYTAITTTGGQSYVDVVLDSGETEQREVTTGSTNYTYIVITDGLTEGERILVPEGTITVSTSSEFRFGGGGFMIPGMRR
jgi:HlyD family secretion protein